MCATSRTVVVNKDNATVTQDRKGHPRTGRRVRPKANEVHAQKVNKEAHVRKANKGTVRNAAETATGRVDQKVPMHPNHLQREPNFVGRIAGRIPGVLR